MAGQLEKVVKSLYFNGTAWTAQTSGTTNDLNGVYMLDANNGWAVGKVRSYAILQRQHPGQSQYTCNQRLTKVFAVDATHVWAVGKGGVVLFYNGSAWSVQATGTTKDIYGVGFTSPIMDGQLANQASCLNSIPGPGQYLIHSLTTKDLNGVYFTGPDNAWAVGKSGTVLQYDGIEWFNQSGGTSNDPERSCTWQALLVLLPVKPAH